VRIIDLRKIRAFLVTAKHRSFTRAAEELSVTQPAVSLMIKEFEEEVGMPLFTRSTRKIHLTPVGEALEIELTRIVNDLTNALSTVTETIRVRQGNVTIASLSSIAIRILPIAIARCKELHPGVAISIRDDTSAKVLERVKSGAADFAISSDDDPSGEIVFNPLFSERFSVVCHRKHFLAQQKGITWEALCTAEFIGMTQETGIGRLVDGINQRQPQQLNFTIRVSQLSTVLGQVEENLGVALLPESAKPARRHHALRAIPLSDVEIVRSIGILNRQDRPLSPAADAAASAIRYAVDTLAGTQMKAVWRREMQ